MKQNLASLVAGLIFGFGLALSGMTHPQKVLDFLDVTGAWNASLLFVLGGAVGVAVLAFRFIFRLKKPLLAERFVISQESKLDAPLIMGATLFGIGWGISGYCPGPAVALLASPNWELLAFLPAAILGAVLEKYVELRKRTKPQVEQPLAAGKPVGESTSGGSCG